MAPPVWSCSSFWSFVLSPPFAAARLGPLAGPCPRPARARVAVGRRCVFSVTRRFLRAPRRARRLQPPRAAPAQQPA
eukprot:11197191-Lingulodinium_polyedra.AAC.1